jgi:hypothetical protein
MPCGMLGVATTPQLQPPRQSAVGALLLAAGREATKGKVTPAPKVAPLPAQAFIHFKTVAMACINFTITTLIRLTGALCPVLCRKTSLPPNHFRIGGKSDTRTATAMHFHTKAGLIFLTDELTNDRYLVDTGATLSIVPCSPSGPLLKGTDGQPIPSWCFI